jgi:transglutaminase-like putative cysteine protease
VPHDARLTLASAVAVLAAGASLVPLVQRGPWVWPVLAGVAIVALLGWGARTVRLPTPFVVLVQMTGLALWLGRLGAGDVATAGVLPNRAWLDQLIATVQDGARVVVEELAPVEAVPGVLLFLVGGVGLVAVACDMLAVGLRRAAWAGLPLAVLYGISTLLNPDGVSPWLFAVAAAGYLSLLLADSRARAAGWGRAVGTWTGSSTRNGGVSRLSTVGVSRLGWQLGGAALALAVLVPMWLPEGGWRLLSTPGGNGGSTTIRTENPIVDLRRDLVRPDDVDLLRVRTQAASPGYLRVITLDVYDGTVWRTELRDIPESHAVSGGMPAPPGLDPDVTAPEVRYDIRATNALASTWLPLPYPATSVEVDGDWRYDRATLDVVARDGSTTAGRGWQVAALDVQPRAQELARSSQPPPELQPMLDLPTTLPPLVTRLAREATAGAQTPFERAVALQEWFRDSGGFVYSLEVAPGNAADDLVAFLQDRTGYCEQFAATMAIMARSLGIPARVAVGYLRGERIDPVTWQISAHDAHAWPELFFAGVGWVRFEPTPAGRSGPVPAYTTDDPTGPDFTGPQGVPIPQDTGEQLPGGIAPDEGAGAAGAGAVRLVGERPWLAVVLLALVLVLPMMAWWLRRRRWRESLGPAALAETAWADIRRTASRGRLGWDDSVTPRSAAQWLAVRGSLDEPAREALRRVVRTVERARYARPGSEAADGAELRADAGAVCAALRRSWPWWRRTLDALWPGPWWVRGGSVGMLAEAPLASGGDEDAAAGSARVPAGSA